jgi:hypothetical protein
MAYVTPPTFVDGNVLSATQLNILSDDIEYLHGIADAHNFGFAMRGGAASTTFDYYIRHKHRYLHYQYRIETHDANEVQLQYGGVMIDADMVGSIGTHNGYYDLNSFGFTVGEWYQTAFIYTSSSTSYITIDYLFELDATTF